MADNLLRTGMRYLRQIHDGFIYEWNETMAAHPKMQEVTEQEAYPERFIPEGQKGRVAKVNMTTKEIPAEEDTSNPLLNAAASKGLPK